MSRFTGERGFTLMELLIVAAILGMVCGAVFLVYDVSQRTYTRAASLEEAQLGARAGLDRMASELRLVGAFHTGATGAGNAITDFSATSITFLADIDADTVGGGAETTTSGATAPGTSVVVNGDATGFTAGERLHISNGAFREVRPIATVGAPGATTTLTLTTGQGLTRNYAAGSIVRSVESVTYAYNDSTHAIEAARNTLTRNWDGTAANLATSVVVGNVTGLTLTYYDSSGTTATTNAALVREIEISLTTEGTDKSRRTLTSRVRPRSLDLQ